MPLSHYEEEKSPVNHGDGCASENRGSVVVQEGYLIEIVNALTNLIPGWTRKLQSGSLKLQAAVQIGSTLDRERQEGFLEFVTDTNVPDLYWGKMLHAFALGMPEWSIQLVLGIYKLAGNTKAAIVMYNDLMDQYEILMRQFEYEFLEGELPTEDDELELALQTVENGLRELGRQAGHDKKRYNRSYGDSSSSSSDIGPGPREASFQTIIGVDENASWEEIRKQSRRLLKKLHPDRGGSAYLFHWVKKGYDAEIAKNSKLEAFDEKGEGRF
ncbi:molecular chaperone DnaJ [Paenibacillus azoreducens]|uniref:molecular chaperone DnaJ n=1 Tax=Paenibacillus azoreducens TaxID=116718 RepID=UPI0039F544E9